LLDLCLIEVGVEGLNPRDGRLNGQLIQLLALNDHLGGARRKKERLAGVKMRKKEKKKKKEERKKKKKIKGRKRK